METPDLTSVTPQGRSRTLASEWRRHVRGPCLAMAFGLLAACGEAPEPSHGTTPDAAPSGAAGTSVPAMPAPPSAVTITGAIPDLRRPVPEGEAESGRITVSWVPAPGALRGFRIYVEGCASGRELALEVAPGERMYGPLNPCRPSRVGVASFNAVGESEITWGIAVPR